MQQQSLTEIASIGGTFELPDSAVLGRQAPELGRRTVARYPSWALATAVAGETDRVVAI